jgi:hypothetical protein
LEKGYMTTSFVDWFDEIDEETRKELADFV